MARRWGAVGVAGLLVLAACGGGDGDDSAPIIEVQGGETAAAADGGTDAVAGAVAGATDEEQALAFAECMRDNGVDFPDPTLDADGSVDFGVGPGAGGAGGFDPQGDGVQEAFAECQSALEGASFLPGDGDLTELEDDLLAFAECLRDQGLDVDDPDLDSFGPGAGDGSATPFGEGFDPADPANADAIEACQGTFTGGPLGG